MSRLISQNVADQILNDYIRSGKIATGEKLPTVRELVGIYGPVSRNTVIHALNILENDGWVVTKPGSGCYVKNSSTECTPKKLSLIGLITKSDDGEIELRLREGVSQVCRAYNAHIIMGSPTRLDYDFEHEQVKRMIDAGCQVIILEQVERTADQLCRDYLKTEYTDVPIVLIDSGYPEQKRPKVVFDNYRAGFDMTRMIIGEGHRRIAFMDFSRRDDSLMYFSTNERYRGYQHALIQAGIPETSDSRVSLTWRAPDNIQEMELAQIMSKWPNDPQRPTAIIALHDLWAIRITQLAQQLGLRVPEDLFVVGFDNLRMARFYSPAFPSTDPDFRRMGEIATQVVMDMLQGAALNESTYILPVPIVRRN